MGDEFPEGFFPGEEGVSFGEFIEEDVIFEFFAFSSGEGDYLPGKDIQLKLVDLCIWVGI